MTEFHRDQPDKFGGEINFGSEYIPWGDLQGALPDIPRTEAYTVSSLQRRIHSLRMAGRLEDDSARGWQKFIACIAPWDINCLKVMESAIAKLPRPRSDKETSCCFQLAALAMDAVQSRSHPDQQELALEKLLKVSNRIKQLITASAAV